MIVRFIQFVTENCLMNAFQEGAFSDTHQTQEHDETTFFRNSFNNAVGHMIVDCTLEGSANGVRDSGALATLTFHVIGTGQSALDLYNATLLDAN
jgi:hypothetical protein